MRVMGVEELWKADVGLAEGLSNMFYFTLLIEMYLELYEGKMIKVELLVLLHYIPIILGGMELQKIRGVLFN